MILQMGHIYPALLLPPRKSRSSESIHMPQSGGKDKQLLKSTHLI